MSLGCARRTREKPRFGGRPLRGDRRTSYSRLIAKKTLQSASSNPLGCKIAGARQLRPVDHAPGDQSRSAPLRCTEGDALFPADAVFEPDERQRQSIAVGDVDGLVACRPELERRSQRAGGGLVHARVDAYGGVASDGVWHRQLLGCRSEPVEGARLGSADSACCRTRVVAGDDMEQDAQPLRPIFTIGYERATLAQVTTALTVAGVELLIDVRAVAASRRAGFSKTILATSLRDAGVEYLHLRDLGTPKAGRDAARAGRCEEMRTIFCGSPGGAGGRPGFPAPAGDRRRTARLPAVLRSGPRLLPSASPDQPTHRAHAHAGDRPRGRDPPDQGTMADDKSRRGRCHFDEKAQVRGRTAAPSGAQVTASGRFETSAEDDDFHVAHEGLHVQSTARAETPRPGLYAGSGLGGVRLLAAALGGRRGLHLGRGFRPPLRLPARRRCGRGRPGQAS